MPSICNGSKTVARYITVGKVKVFSLGSELVSVAAGGLWIAASLEELFFW